MLETIAFIPDGNRRYSKQKNIPYEKAYLKGTEKAWEVMEWLTKYSNIKNGVFYTFSLKNFDRNIVEKKALMKIFENELKSIIKDEKKQEFLRKNKIKLKFIGNKKLFPTKIKESMSIVEELTKGFGGRTIYLAVGYDGQDEIINAVNKFVKDVAEGKTDSKANLSRFKQYLYLNVEPDLIIRTSPEKRLSGFLTFQSAYSELAFIEKYWPDIQEKDLREAIDNFENRKRRFGK